MNKIEFKKNVSDFFQELVNNHENRLCPDQYVGKISKFTDTQNDFIVREDTNTQPKRDNSCIIMVLESPHIDEYKNNPAPAKGKTGKYIRSYIKEILKDVDDINNYGLILINAVQYQCSLGKPTKYYRDNIFIKIWKNEGKHNFQDRLKKIYKPDDFIINCCTNGNNKQKLRDLVQKAIEEINDVFEKDIQLFRINHPSSWWKIENRKLLRIN